MDRAETVCDKKGCSDTAMVRLSYTEKGRLLEIDFCRKHVGDCMKVLLEIEKLVHE